MGKKLGWMLAAVAFFACGGTADWQRKDADQPEVTGQTGFELNHPHCTLERDLATCVTTDQRYDVRTEEQVGKCMRFSGDVFVEGRRVRTLENTYLVTQTTETRRKGIDGPVVDTKTSKKDELTSSSLIADECQPI